MTSPRVRLSKRGRVQVTRPIPITGPVRYAFTQADRAEQNAIAAAILNERHNLPDTQAIMFGPSDRQLPADPAVTKEREAWLEAYTLAWECVNLVALGEHQQAFTASQEAIQARRRYTRLETSALKRQRTRSGRYREGTTWFVVLDDITFFFDLVLWYDDQTNRLTVANGDELRHASGVLEADQAAWRDLARWIETHESDSTPGPEVEDGTLVWRDKDGSLVLREPIKRNFPGLIFALEALRVTLRAER